VNNSKKNVLSHLHLLCNKPQNKQSGDLITLSILGESPIWMYFVKPGYTYDLYPGFLVAELVNIQLNINSNDQSKTFSWKLPVIPPSQDSILSQTTTYQLGDAKSDLDYCLSYEISHLQTFSHQPLIRQPASRPGYFLPLNWIGATN